MREENLGNIFEKQNSLTLDCEFIQSYPGMSLALERSLIDFSKNGHISRT